MEHWMIEISHHVALIIEAMALLIIAVSSLMAFAGSVRLMFSSMEASNHDKRALWLRYARWLVAALTFQLAADLVNSSISPTWDAIGRLAAIAAIRTFLSYFLERDVLELSNTQRERAEANAQARGAERAMP